MIVATSFLCMSEQLDKCPIEHNYINMFCPLCSTVKGPLGKIRNMPKNT